jgi:hypothetical protein
MYETPTCSKVVTLQFPQLALCKLQLSAALVQLLLQLRCNWPWHGPKCGHVAQAGLQVLLVLVHECQLLLVPAHLIT